MDSTCVKLRAFWFPINDFTYDFLCCFLVMYTS